MTSEHRPQLVAIVDDDQSVPVCAQGLDGIRRAFGAVLRISEEFLESDERKETACPSRGHSDAGDVRPRTASEAKGRRVSHSNHPLSPAHGDAKMKMQAMKAGAVEFLSKPFDDEVLLEKVPSRTKGLNQKNHTRIFQEEQGDEFKRPGFLRAARSLTFGGESQVKCAPQAGAQTDQS